MSADHVIQLAETLQTASIKRHPSPSHDINPSTAASRKEPVRFESEADLDDVLSDAENADEDEIPVSVLRPVPRKPQMPPLPDLRFEQSYLASIKNADTWQKVAFITLRDQVRNEYTGGYWNSSTDGFAAFHATRSRHGLDVGGSRLEGFQLGLTFQRKGRRS